MLGHACRHGKEEPKVWSALHESISGVKIVKRTLETVNNEEPWIKLSLQYEEAFFNSVVTAKRSCTRMEAMEVKRPELSQFGTWMPEPPVNRNPAEVDPYDKEQGRANLARASADRPCGFAPTNIRVRPNDQKRPCVEQVPVSWVAAQIACGAMAHCRD